MSNLGLVHFGAENVTIYVDVEDLRAQANASMPASLQTTFIDTILISNF